MKNIVIINSVPLNGGDEAILTATVLLIKKHLKESKVYVLCDAPEAARKYLPNIDIEDFYYDYHVVAYYEKISVTTHIKNSIKKFLNNYSRFNYKLIEKKNYTEPIAALKNADLILSSGGSYINDFYNSTERYKTLQFVKNLNIPFLFLNQSMGPFWKKNYLELHRINISIADRIVLRENISRTHLEGINVKKDKLLFSPDLAFYLHTIFEKSIQEENTSENKIAINFRAWKDDETNIKISELAINLIEFIFTLNPGIELVFLSTCQGLKEYTDDLIFMKKIITQLPTDMQNKCHYDSHKYTLIELGKVLGSCKAYVGMRLHVAILAMINYTPSFNIGYEDKTEGIYKDLGLEEQYCNIDNDLSIIINKLSIFMQSLSATEINLTQIIEEKSAQVSQDFKTLLNEFHL